MFHEIPTFGLGNVYLPRPGRTRSICAENPKGEKGAGAQAIPDGGAARRLGQGWKVRPCIDLPAGETTTLAEIEGPGLIQHIWITATDASYRDCILRMYWDGEETPSVEVPLGDFFCCGHSLRTTVNSMPIAVNPSGAFNSYWPMPFHKSARITIENQRWEEIKHFFFQITWAETPIPAEAAMLHAQWRRAMGTRECPEHVLLDGVRGRGQYVGTYLAWTQLSNGWWGEGEVKFFIDGDQQFPTICGTGTEDYFGGAWGFYGPEGKEQPYSTPFLGLPLVRHVVNEVPRFGLYRWHIMDPIRFDEDLRVTIQELGWWPDGTYEPLTDDVASTAYWYQSEPHAAFPAMLPIEQRWSR
jgi:hypothetical protein